MLVMGWIPVSPLLNLACFTGMIAVWLKYRKKAAPAWLLAVNTLFFFTQLIYFLAIYR